MQHRATSLIAATLIAGAFALSACQGEDEAVANAGNDADPALTSALENEIMVDPNLAQGNQAARAGGQTAASAPGGNAAARAPARRRPPSSWRPAPIRDPRNEPAQPSRSGPRR